MVMKDCLNLIKCYASFIVITLFVILLNFDITVLLTNRNKTS